MADLRVPVASMLDAFGLPITVTVPNWNPVTTTGIWLQATEDPQPSGVDLKRREPRRVLAVPRDAASTVPRGSIIVAPDCIGGAEKTWRVDGIERTEPDLLRLIVVVASD